MDEKNHTLILTPNVWSEKYYPKSGLFFTRYLKEGNYRNDGTNREIYLFSTYSKTNMWQIHPESLSYAVTCARKSEHKNIILDCLYPLADFNNYNSLIGFLGCLLAISEQRGGSLTLMETEDIYNHLPDNIDPPEEVKRDKISLEDHIYSFRLKEYLTKNFKIKKF